MTKTFKNNYTIDDDKFILDTRMFLIDTLKNIPQIPSSFNQTSTSNKIELSKKLNLN